MPPIPGYAHLAKDDTHRGGAVRVASHNLPVSGLLQMYESGMTPRQIADWYDDLPLAAVFSALAYAADHAEEMTAELQAEQQFTAEQRQKHPLPNKIRAALERGTVLP